MIHFIVHVLGLDTQKSYWYDLWSGFANMVSPAVFLALIAMRRERKREHEEHMLYLRLLTGTPEDNKPALGEEPVVTPAERIVRDEYLTR